MRPVIFALVLLVFSSCSGFFDENSAEKDGVSIAPLAVSGGGYLSTDEYNEITPFIFRDPATGKVYLFFSSDRSGNYDIYYAEMFEDETFANPVKMTNAINSTSNEISPVVFFGYATGGYQLLISFIQISTNYSSTNIVTWIIDSNTFAIRDYVQDNYLTNATRIGYEIDPTNIINGGRLMVSFGKKQLQMCNKGTVNTEFRWGLLVDGEPRTNGQTLNIAYPASAANGFYDTYFNSYRYIFQDNNCQFFGGNIYSVIVLVTNTNFFDIPFYASPYRDCDPFVDSGDTMRKVYFASDRYGKGNFDLYRYNYMTYWAVGAY